MNIIKLINGDGGGPVFVNSDKINYFEPSGQGSYLEFAADDVMYVSNTVEEILCQINGEHYSEGCHPDGQKGVDHDRARS